MTEEGIVTSIEGMVTGPIGGGPHRIWYRWYRSDEGGLRWSVWGESELGDWKEEGFTEKRLEAEEEIHRTIERWKWPA